MWSLFSRDPIKDFSCDIGEAIRGLEGKTVWAFHGGKRKGSGEAVSIFAFDIKAASESQVQTARDAVKRLKTLRHPNILTYVDSVETDKTLYFATEPVVPLETYLQNNTDSHNEAFIAWGLHQLLKGLSFLVNDCNLIHNNLCMASVFVDAAGEWKLGGVDYMYSAQGSDSTPPVKTLPVLRKYDPPEKSDNAKVTTNKCASDMWGLGCLIWEVFNGTLPSTASLKSLGKIPKTLVPKYCELVSANPKSRPNPGAFLQELCKKGGFLNNSFVSTMLFLEEIQIKDQSEKNKFFSSLTPCLDSFPPQVCRYKILPQLLNVFEYGNAGSSVLQPMLKIGKHLDTEEYQKKIIPCVIKLFSSPDRSTRVNLLQQTEFFVEHLSQEVVNGQIFASISSGFMDTNPVVREATVKAMLYLASKLNYKNLNEELMKHFARLQTKDDQGGIRTNTTVCLGKIACHLNPAIREKILISAFLRALKDPFPPARQAGILAMAATQHFYHMNELAHRLLPALCSMTRDPEKAVRDQTFKAIKSFLDKLEELSEDPDRLEDMERDVLAGGSSSVMSSAASWTGWAVTGMSSLTSKIYHKTAVRTTQVPAVSSDDSSKSKAPAAISKKELDDGKEVDRTSTTECETHLANVDSAAKTTEEDVGWDDDEDWGSLDDTEQFKEKTVEAKSLSTKVASSAMESWTDNDFTSEDSGMPSASQYNWGSEDVQDDFFSSATNKRLQSQASSSPLTSSRSRGSVSKKTGGSDGSRAASVQGWDDAMDDSWATDNWQSTESDVATDADMKKREREEKRLQRQKELQEKREARKGGAMKLGAKKI